MTTQLLTTQQAAEVNHTTAQHADTIFRVVIEQCNCNVCTRVYAILDVNVYNCTLVQVQVS
jgi:hypothetical protein